MASADWLANAMRALAVYRDRGREALALLERGRDDEAHAVLKLRGAAFKNFRAVDALALAGGADLAKTPAAQALWDEIRAGDAALAAQLERAKARSEALYKKLRDARAKIGKYRSRQGGDPQ